MVKSTPERNNMGIKHRGWPVLVTVTTPTFSSDTNKRNTVLYMSRYICKKTYSLDGTNNLICNTKIFFFVKKYYIIVMLVENVSRVTMALNQFHQAIYEVQKAKMWSEQRKRSCSLSQIFTLKFYHSVNRLIGSLWANIKVIT